MSKFKRKQSNPIQKNNTLVKTNKNPNNGKNGNGNGNGRNGKLTFKQSKFVECLLADPKGNASQAALLAGYSEKGAGIQAFYLLKNIKIQNALAKGRERLTAKFRMNQEWVLKRYEMLADYCIDDFFNDDGTMKLLSEIPKDKLYAIGGFKQSKTTITTKDEKLITDRIREFKLPDKKGVLDSVGKYLKMFDGDSGNGGSFNFNGPVQINVRLADDK